MYIDPTYCSHQANYGEETRKVLFQAGEWIRAWSFATAWAEPTQQGNRNKKKDKKGVCVCVCIYMSPVPGPPHPPPPPQWYPPPTPNPPHPPKT